MADQMPWEKYAAQDPQQAAPANASAEGPWAKYSQADQAQPGTNQSSAGSNPASAGGSKPVVTAAAAPTPSRPVPQPAQHTPWGPEGSTLRAIQNVLATPEGGFQSQTMNQLGHGVGLAGGMLGKAFTGTGGLIADAGAGIANMAGAHVPMPSQQFANQFPQPQGGMEKAADFAGTMGLGMIADPLANAFAKGIAPNAPQPRPPTAKEITLQQGRSNGLVVPPSQAPNPSLTGRLLEGFAGRDAVENAARLKNQPVFDAMARRAADLPEGAQLSDEAVKSATQRVLEQGYAPVRQAGAMRTSPEYNQALDKVINDFHGSPNQSFPGAYSPDVQDLVKKFRVPGFDSNDAVDAISKLRGDAGKAFRMGDNEFGGAQRKVASALEGNIESGLNGYAGNGIGSDVLSNFRNARQTLAKQNVVQNAIREGTGSVNAAKIAGVHERAPGYLTDELKDIGQFANTFPRASGMPTQGATTPKLSWIPPAVAGAIAGPIPAIAMAATPFGRMAAQKALLSNAGQRMFVDPKLDPGALRKLMADPRFYKALPAGFSNLFNDGGNQ